MIAFKLSVCHSPTPSNIAEECQAKMEKKKQNTPNKKRSSKGKKLKKKKKRTSKKKHSQAIDTKLKQAELKKPKENT